MQLQTIALLLAIGLVQAAAVPAAIAIPRAVDNSASGRVLLYSRDDIETGGTIGYWGEPAEAVSGIEADSITSTSTTTKRYDCWPFGSIADRTSCSTYNIAVASVCRTMIDILKRNGKQSIAGNVKALGYKKGDDACYVAWSGRGRIEGMRWEDLIPAAEAAYACTREGNGKYVSAHTDNLVLGNTCASQCLSGMPDCS